MRNRDMVMDPLSMFIFLSIGNVVGWLAGMYWKNALPGLIGHVVVSTIGAFVAGFLMLRFIQYITGLGVIAGAFVGAALLLYFVRLKKLS